MKEIVISLWTPVCNPLHHKRKAIRWAFYPKREKKRAKVKICPRVSGVGFNPTNVLTVNILQTFHLKFNKDSIESVVVGFFCYVSVYLSGKWQESSGTSRRCGREDEELEPNKT